MIDLIRLKKTQLSDYETAVIVAKNKLRADTKGLAACYTNKHVKNLNEQGNGVYIDIDTTRTLTVECSLHKYFNEIIRQKGRQNYDLFTMKQAKEALTRMLNDKGINPAGMKVTYCEVGLNMELSKVCKKYLQKMRNIIKADKTKRRFYINPKFKGENALTTEFHDKIRVQYKAYNKGVEVAMKDKRRIFVAEILDTNILRIETVYRRLEKELVTSFFSERNLRKIKELFFNEWNNVEFEPDVFFPLQTGSAKKALIKDILINGKEKTLQIAKEEHVKGSLTDKEYRNKREFIQNDWDTFKAELKIEQSPEEKEYRKELEKFKRLLFKNL